MKEYNLFGFKVEIDEVTTKKWYDRSDRTDKDSDVTFLDNSYVKPFSRNFDFFVLTDE